MPGTKTNERPGTRAQVRYARVSAYKARPVLDLIRGKDVAEADSLLRFSERDVAGIIRKLLGSAVANAEHNDGQAADELYVSACYADEGPTLKRWRPRARGRATRIRKRTSHLTIIVSRLPDEEVDRRRAAEAASGRARGQSAEARRRRVARSRAAQQPEATERGVGHDDEQTAPVAETEPEVVEAVEAAGAADASEPEEPDTTAGETVDDDQVDEGMAASVEPAAGDTKDDKDDEDEADERTGDDQKGKA
jgi:large subunit ribosomal protein L22